MFPVLKPCLEAVVVTAGTCFCTTFMRLAGPKSPEHVSQVIFHSVGLLVAIGVGILFVLSINLCAHIILVY